MSSKKPFSRLPLTVVPSNYAIRLQPDLNKFTFLGNEKIDVEVKEEVREVKLNCVDIEISSASYSSPHGSFKAKWEYNQEEELVTLAFDESLKPGNGSLSLDFTGELNDKMKGFYRSRYTTPAGQTRFAAVTQFEPTDARRAFPCWDEPAVKATFDVTLVSPKDRVALSNMHVVEEKDLESDASLKVVRFAPTPIMSTYLLAFVVGEYDYVEDKTTNGVLVRVYTPVGKKEQGNFALEVTLKSLPFYKDYFGIAYPLKKMDLIAISDFAAGAMENWGLVTYRETCVLIDPENSSSMAKQRVAIVVAHELAHQWFGNLVTMEWWTHLWLNEGFASFMEYLVVDHFFPEYRIWDQFVASDTARALELDALKSSHAIEVPVCHPSEIDEIFDVISYSKGASVIRMLHNWIGDKAFRSGLKHYLEKFSYKNAFTEDLWASLEWASEKPVEKVMRTWTEKMGFPVLTVSEKQEGNSRILEFSQSRFIADGSDPGSFQWLVPVTVSCGSKPNQICSEFVIDDTKKTVKINDIPATDWIKVNPGRFGFFRVNYSSDMLSHLLPAVKSNTLPSKDRLGLGSDLFALSQAGVTSTVEYLRLVDAFENEEDFNVLGDIGNSLGSLRVLLSNSEADSHLLLQPFVVKVFEKLGARLGWDAKEGESHVDALLRSLVLGKLGYYGHQETVKEALKRVKDHAETSNLAADLRVPTYITSLVHGDEAIFDTLLGLFKKAELQEEKMRVARCLGSVHNPALIKRTLEFSMSDQVRSQDTVFVITSCCGTKSGRELTWQFVQDNFKELHSRYEGGFLLSRLIKETCKHFASEAKAVEIEAFFKKNPAPAAERNVKQACENVRLNAAWLSRDGEAIKKWLKK